MHHTYLQLKPARPLRSRRGYSLMDALVGTALGLTAMAAVLGLYRFQFYGLLGHSARVDVQSTARSIVQLMVSEIRRSGADPRCTKAFEGVAEATPNRLRILSDLNGSGAIDAPGEDVTYSWDASTGILTRTAGGASDTLSDPTVRVTSLQFRYFDSAGTELVPGSTDHTRHRTRPGGWPGGGLPGRRFFQEPELGIYTEFWDWEHELPESTDLPAAQRSQVLRIWVSIVAQRRSPDPWNSQSLSVTVSSSADLRNRFFVNTLGCL